MKKIHLLCYLFIWVSLFESVSAQVTSTQLKVPTIAIGDASRYIGSMVKLNCDEYKTVDDGKTLSIYMKVRHQEKSLMLILTGESRKKAFDEMRIRRRLNSEVKQPLDTSITATGKIVSYNNHLRIVITRAKDVYLGADLKVEQP
ncbi:hypothetical protein SAMN05216464_103192 [Mucilaginibacter pineti]|uniref:Uncharacterized protein n=1 Tax=Mucilaginibacter pineti TaxID=1391627 RepID=A0A1G6Z279_9SPHI|nr:hypothetical protein [Mucilaginibacter pineti]SDD96844.1 hypothetical protein SAMN05216464_103192 [Mucilaginibacter pineti]